MPTLPIILEVQDVEVGPLLITLWNQAGVVKIGIPPPPAPRSPIPRKQGIPPSSPELIVAALTKADGGPVKFGDLQRETDLPRSSLRQTLKTLNFEKAVEHGPNHGTWQLSKKAKLAMAHDPVNALASPISTAAKANKQDIKRGPAGRASPGAGRKQLLQALAAGTNKRRDLIRYLCERGMTPNGAENILYRANRDKLVASDGRGRYVPTTMGKKAIAEQAHFARKRKHEGV